MLSLTARYLAGDREAVWNELRALGPVPEAKSADVAAVAAETMRRVRRHTERLGEAYEELGLDSLDARTVEPLPDAAELAELDRYVAAIGPLPYALDACLRFVGSVSLMGDCEALDLWYRDTERTQRSAALPDPLVTPPIFILGHDLDGYLDDYGPDSLHAEEDDGPPPPFSFGFAPDRIHKANFSGGTQDIELPSPVADPLLRGCGWDSDGDLTLVEYLRLSIAWGGLPGWSWVATPPPAALAALRVTPDF